MVVVDQRCFPIHEQCQKPVYDLLYTHDLLPPMLAQGFRDLRFGFCKPCLVEILFHGKREYVWLELATSYANDWWLFQY